MVRSVDELIKIPGGGSKPVVDWVFTPITEELAPVNTDAVASSVAAGSTQGRYDLSLQGPLTSYATFFYSALNGSGPLGADGLRWMDYIIPASDAGDNLAFIMVMLRPTTTTIADAVANAFATEPPVGYNSVVFQYNVAAGSALGGFITGGAADNSSADGLSFVAGDRMQLGWNQTTGEVLIGKNSGTPVAVGSGSAPQEVRDEEMVPTIMVFTTASTPAFNAGVIDMTFSSAEAGFPGYSTSVAPDPPEGTRDGDRYKITTNDGTLFGKTVRQGDVIEFFAGATDIFIIRNGDPVAIADTAVEAGKAGDALEVLKKERKLFPQTGLVDWNDGLATLLAATGHKYNGIGFIVGPAPEGDFATFTSGNIAYWDSVAGEYREFDPADDTGAPVSPSGYWQSGWELRLNEHWGGGQYNSRVLTLSKLKGSAADTPHLPDLRGNESWSTQNWIVLSDTARGAGAETYARFTDTFTAAAFTNEKGGSAYVRLTQSGDYHFDPGSYGLSNNADTLVATRGVVILHNDSGSNKYIYSEVYRWAKRVNAGQALILETEWVVGPNSGAPGELVFKPKEVIVPTWDNVSLAGQSTYQVPMNANCRIYGMNTALTITLPKCPPLNGMVAIEFDADVHDLTMQMPSGDAVGGEMPVSARQGQVLTFQLNSGRWTFAGRGDEDIKPNSSRSGTTYTIEGADIYKRTRHTSSSPTTVTVPLNSTTPIPIGAVVEGWQTNTGAVTLVGETGGVNLRSVGGALTTSGQYAQYKLKKVASDEWLVSGDLVV